MHTHIALFRQVNETKNSLTLPYHGAVAAARLEGMLMNGFTTIMDTGGPAKFAQRLVDEGIFKGPRIYPSEAMISQTLGDGDLRTGTEPHPNVPGNHTPLGQSLFLHCGWRNRNAPTLPYGRYPIDSELRPNELPDRSGGPSTEDAC